MIPTEEALEAFKHFDADLDDSPDPIPAYGLASNISFEVPLEGERLSRGIWVGIEKREHCY